MLQLAANNKIELTQTLVEFYPNAPDELKLITITQLLGHTSGLDNFHNDSDFEFMDKAEAERRILSMPLIAKPVINGLFECGLYIIGSHRRKGEPSTISGIHSNSNPFSVASV